MGGCRARRGLFYLPMYWRREEAGKQAREREREREQEKDADVLGKHESSVDTRVRTRTRKSIMEDPSAGNPGNPEPPTHPLASHAPGSGSSTEGTTALSCGRSCAVPSARVLSQRVLFRAAHEVQMAYYLYWACVQFMESLRPSLQSRKRENYDLSWVYENSCRRCLPSLQPINLTDFPFLCARRPFTGHVSPGVC
jgi:hypothetical protein